MDEQNNKNTILAIVLTVAIIFGWQMYMGRTGSVSAPESQKEHTDFINNNLSSQDNDKILDRNLALKKNPYLAIQSNELVGGINLRGAIFDDLILKTYYYYPDHKGGNVLLLNPMHTAYPYYVRFSWEGKGTDMPNRNTLWHVQGNRVLTSSNPVTLFWTSKQGVTFQQTYKMDAYNMISVQQTVINHASVPISITPYGIVARIGTPKLVDSYLLHEGMIGYLSNSLREIKYKTIKEDTDEHYHTTGGWLGITDKYWLVALILNQKKHIFADFRSGVVDGRTIYQANAIDSTSIIQPGHMLKTNIKFFAGPKLMQRLVYYQNMYHIPKFKLAVDFGMLYFLTEPLFHIIHWLSMWLGNFGLAILALTIIIKFILFPLSYKSYLSMLRMKFIHPKIQLLKESFSGDRQKLHMETMALYKKEGINPMSGCFSVIVQLPIFFALYKVLFITIEMRQAPFFGWIKDLSAPDPIGILTGFGLFHWKIPVLLQPINITLWPMFMGFSMWIQQRSTITSMDPQQEKIMKWFPIVFPFFMIHFPVGLVIYWTWNNVLTAIQQWVISLWLAYKHKDKYTKY